MKGWTKVIIRDVAEVIDCPHSTPKWKDEGIFAVRNYNLANGKIIKTKASFVDEETFINRTKRGVPEKGDTILSREAPIGTVGYVGNSEKMCLGQRVVLIKPKSIDGKFLAYQLISSSVQQQFDKSKASGATVSNLRIPIIEETQLIVPTTDDQEKISSTIFAYDELIENNQKRIRILEEMAQRLYTEWFVRFIFPGHEGIRMVNSGTEFGEIPDGWVVKELSDIGKVITGSTPSKQKPQYYGSNYMLIKTPDFNQGVFLISTEESLSKNGFEVLRTRLLPKHTVMVSTIGTLGKVAITTEESFTNQQINSLVLNNPNDYIYFYFFAKGLKRKLEGLGSNGATMGNVSKSKYEGIAIIYPAKSILEDYFKLSSSNFLEIETLIKKNKILVDMRDNLIENLVTGKRILKKYGKTN